MKPTLVDNCEHYNRTTHVCDKCGRGLPDVCLEFEEMKKKAAAYETAKETATRKETQSSVEGTDNNLNAIQMETIETQEPKKTRGRPRKVNVETNITD